jgi:hypothetical protein
LQSICFPDIGVIKFVPF